jgi:hypothetical protein
MPAARATSVNTGSTGTSMPVSPVLASEPPVEPPTLEVASPSRVVLASDPLLELEPVLVSPSLTGSTMLVEAIAPVLELSGTASSELVVEVADSPPEPHASVHMHAITTPARTPSALADGREIGKQRCVDRRRTRKHPPASLPVPLLAPLPSCMPMASPLTEVDDDVWVVARPQRFLGVQLGTRMTVVRLPGGDLVLHSPVALDDALRGAIDDLGRVRHVIAPNYYHHLHAGDATAVYPEAALHGAPKLARKRPDLRLTSELGDAPIPGIGDALVPIAIHGSLLRETVFFHARTRTLVAADLIENFRSSEFWFTRLYLRISGVLGRPGVGRLLRPMFRDRAAARADIDRILALDVRRITVCHGDLVEEDAREVLRGAYDWL